MSNSRPVARHRLLAAEHAVEPFVSKTIDAARSERFFPLERKFERSEFVPDDSTSSLGERFKTVGSVEVFA